MARLYSDSYACQTNILVIIKSMLIHYNNNVDNVDNHEVRPSVIISLHQPALGVKNNLKSG